MTFSRQVSRRLVYAHGKIRLSPSMILGPGIFGRSHSKGFYHILECLVNASFSLSYNTIFKHQDHGFAPFESIAVMYAKDDFCPVRSSRLACWQEAWTRWKGFVNTSDAIPRRRCYHCYSLPPVVTFHTHTGETGVLSL
jgi:hypothetical protein